jgi:DNA-binding CsgD family transcriptional regulator
MARTVDDLLRFINTFPTESNPPEWAGRVSRAIRIFLGDVDLVWVNVGMMAMATDPAITMADSLLRNSVPPHELSDAGIFKFLCHDDYSARNCHPLHRFDYHLPGTAWLGSIALLRRKPGPAISEETLYLMEGIRSFIASQMLHVHQARHEEQAIATTFSGIVDIIAREIGLTDREKEVMLPRAFGMSYKEIAEQLHLTPVAIKKRVLRIHKKANVSSQLQLFGKYLSPYFVKPSRNSE